MTTGNHDAPCSSASRTFSGVFAVDGPLVPPPNAQAEPLAGKRRPTENFDVTLSPSAESPGREVTLVRDQTKLWVFPRCDEVLDRLTTRTHKLATTASRGCAIATSTRRLCPFFAVTPKLREVFEQESVSIEQMSLVGLEPALRYSLENAGYEVTTFDQAPALSSPDLEASGRVGPVDREVLEVLAVEPRLVVRHGDKVDKARIIAQIALTFPDATIAVGTARRGEAQDLGRRLRQWVPDTTIATAEGPGGRPAGRVVVGTFTALSGTGVRLCHRDIYVAAHALESLGELGKLPLNEAQHARFVGLIPADLRLSPHDADELRAYFGFIDVHVPTHGQHLLPINVIVECNKSAPHLAEAANLVEIKRAGVWRNPVRNRRVAALAKLVAAGELQGLAARFPKVAEGLANCADPRVALLADNVEHALELARRLPGWSIATAPGLNLTGLSRADRDLLAQAQAEIGQGNKAITTMAAAQQMRVNQLDAVIRADAGTGLPPWSGEQLRISNASDHRVLLVDIADERHPMVRRFVRQRDRAYRRAEWFPPGSDPVIERVKRFLSTRPGRPR